MGMTLAEKILAAKCGKDKVVPNEIVIVPVDCAMMTDILGPRMISEEFNRLGMPIKKPDQRGHCGRSLHSRRHRASGGDS